MNSFLNYLLQSALAVTVLYGVFKLLFERLANFAFNRFFLLGSVFFALVIPLLHISMAANVSSLSVPGTPGLYLLPEISLGATSQSFSASQFWMGIYGFGALLLSLRFLRQLLHLAQLKKSSSACEQYQGYRIAYTNQRSPAFTFGRTIFLSHSVNFSPAEKEVILAHERVHVKQLHSLDILLLEATIILQWFNPVIWLLKKSLRDQHEFLADRAGVKAAPDFNFYARQIIGQVLNVSPSALTHNFSSSQLKKRIIMMQQKTTLRSAIARTALVLPIAGFLFYSIACDGAKPGITPQPTDKTTASAHVEKAAGELETRPSFKGDNMAMYDYISANIKVPEMNDPQLGKVFASFVVKADGKVTEVKILKGVGEPYDSEVTRVFAGMPNWNPARKNGKAVDMKMVVPIAFNSQNAGSNTQRKATKNNGLLFRGFESKFDGC